MARKGGKGSRARAKLRRKKERRARKEARQAQYQRWSDQGINQKSKRQVKKAGRKGPRKRGHPLGKCGNPACQHCYGVNFEPFLKNGEPHNMPHWMYLEYERRRQGLETLAKAEL